MLINCKIIHNPFHATVLFEGSNLTLRTTVTVQTGYTLSVVAPVEILTNVPFPGKGYNFSVNFRFVDFVHVNIEY